MRLLALEILRHLLRVSLRRGKITRVCEGLQGAGCSVWGWGPPVLRPHWCVAFTLYFCITVSPPYFTLALCLSPVLRCGVWLNILAIVDFAVLTSHSPTGTAPSYYG